MEPDETPKAIRLIADLINRIACKFGDHTWSWKLKKGETISSQIPDKAKCQYCGKTKGVKNG